MKLVSGFLNGSGFEHEPDNCPVCRVMQELGLEGEIVDLDSLTPEELEKLEEAFEEANEMREESWEEALIEVTVCYDRTLCEITGVKEEAIHVPEGLPFLLFLQVIFDRRPQIEENYPPGILGFALDGHPPGQFEILEAGSVVQFVVC